MADLVEVSLELIGTEWPSLLCHEGVRSVLPAPQRGPQVVSSVWEEQVAGGRRGDGLEHRTTSAGRLVNSGSQEII